MAQQRKDLSNARENVSDFVAYLVTVYGTQHSTAEALRVGQSTIAQLISKVRNPGTKVLLQLAESQCVSPDEILSGVALAKLRARRQPNTASDLNMLRAVRALSELYDLPRDEVLEIFRELGESLSSDLPATVFFDVGRSAIERRAHGAALLRRVE